MSVPTSNNNNNNSNISSDSQQHTGYVNIFSQISPTAPSFMHYLLSQLNISLPVKSNVGNEKKDSNDNTQSIRLDSSLCYKLELLLASNEFVSYCRLHAQNPSTTTLLQLTSGYITNNLKSFQLMKLNQFIHQYTIALLSKLVNNNSQSQLRLFSNLFSARIHSLRLFQQLKYQEHSNSNNNNNDNFSPSQCIIYVPATPFIEEFIEKTAFELQLSTQNFKFIPIKPVINSTDSPIQNNNDDAINALLLHTVDEIALENEIIADKQAGLYPLAILATQNAEFNENSIFHSDSITQLLPIVKKHNIFLHIEGCDVDKGLLLSSDVNSIIFDLQSIFPHLRESIYFSSFRNNTKNPNIQTPGFDNNLYNFNLLFNLWFGLVNYSSKPNQTELHQLLTIHQKTKEEYKNQFYSMLIKQGFSIQLIVPEASNNVINQLLQSNENKFNSFFFQLTTLSDPSQFNISINQINQYLAHRIDTRLNNNNNNNNGNISSASTSNSNGHIIPSNYPPAFYCSSLIPVRFHSLFGFLFHPTIIDCIYNTSKQFITSQMMLFDNIFQLIKEELNKFELIIQARNKLQSLLDKETEFIYIAIDQLKLPEGNNTPLPTIGYGCIQFKPIQLSDDYLNEINELLCSSLQTQTSNLRSSILFFANTHSIFQIGYTESGSTVLIMNLQCLFLENPIKIEDLFNLIKKAAKKLDLSTQIHSDLAATIREGIAEAEKKLHLNSEENYYSTSNVIRMLPIVGGLINYWSPIDQNAHNNVTLMGQSFDIRSRELSTITYSYENQTPSLVTHTHTPTNSIISKPSNLQNSDSLDSISSSSNFVKSAVIKPTVQIFHPNFDAEYLQPNQRLMNHLLLKLHDGQKFIAYFPVDAEEESNQNQFTSAEIFVFYESSFYHSTTNIVDTDDTNYNSSSETSSTHNGINNNNNNSNSINNNVMLAELGSGPILGWCEIGARYLTADQAIAIQDIKQIAVGLSKLPESNNSKIQLDSNLSISIITPQVNLHLQAKTIQQRNQFFLAIYNYLVQNAKIELINTKQPQTITHNNNNNNNNNTRNSMSSSSNNGSNSPGKNAPVNSSQSPLSSSSSLESVLAARTLLEQGQPFVVYVLDKNNIDLTTRHEVMLWYKPGDLSSPDGKSSGSSKGNLAWCKRGTTELDYSPSRSLPLSKTVQICMGKQTKAFKNKQAQNADSSCCFSIMVEKMILNLEAGSNAQRTEWLNAFHTVMTAAGKQRIFDQDQEEQQKKTPTTANNNNNNNNSTTTSKTPSTAASNNTTVTQRDSVSSTDGI